MWGVGGINKKKRQRREGEGTFGYKHLVPYFQIAQNKKNLFVLNAIESYLVNIYKESVTVSRSIEGESSKNY